VLTFTAILITLFQKQNLLMQENQTGFWNRLKQSQAWIQLEGYWVTRALKEVMRTAKLEAYWVTRALKEVMRTAKLDD
jgi:hypothetical protein